MDIKLSKKHGVNPSLDLCLFCGEPKGIALLGRLPNDAEAPRHIVTSDEPCDTCKDNMSQGYSIIECDLDRQPTGRYVVITLEAAESLGMPESKHNRALALPEDFTFFTRQDIE